MAFPTIVSNDGGIQDLATLVAWAGQEAGWLKARLATTGAILFRGFPIGTVEDFDAFSAAFGYADFISQESLSSALRSNLTPRVFTANEVPPGVEIFLHHELAHSPAAPELIFFCCLGAAEEGGATLLCRSDLLLAAFEQLHPRWAARFEALGVRYRTRMPADNDPGSGQGRSWRSTLGVDTAAAAEARLAGLGYKWQWLQNQSLLATSPVLPAVRTLADGSRSFFNQVIAAWRGWQRPASDGAATLTFGNGETIPEAALEALGAIADTLAAPINWQDGDVALVDNHRVMHGRQPYAGKRHWRVLVCLAREAVPPN